MFRLQLTGVETLDHSVLLKTHRGNDKGPDGCIRIDGVSPSVLRIRFVEGRELSEGRPSFMLRSNLPSCPITVMETEELFRISTGALTLVVRKSDLRFAWYDGEDCLLAEEVDGKGKGLAPYEVYRSVFDDGSETVVEKTVDGEKTRVSGVNQVHDRTDFTATLCYQLQDEEAIYGLGQHEEGILNYRGQTQYLYQQNMKVAMPSVVSSRGWGLFLNAQSLVTFRDDRYGMSLCAEVVPELDYFFVAGPEFDTITGAFRALCGPLPMLPRWSYGYVQSKERYVSQQDLLETAAEYRRRKLPIDCIVQDWQTWPRGQWGQKSFDPERFPDPSALTRQLHEMDIKLMLSIWPIMRNNENQAEMREQGYLLGNDSTYDAFNPDATALYWDQCERGLFRHGIDAWWCDCTEPFEADWKGEVKPEPWQRLQINTGELKKYLDGGLINAYSVPHSQGIYDGQRATDPSKRVINLTRSGFPGQHRYATVTWSGDIEATWERMRCQIAEGLSFCITGNPRWTLDIGAFFVTEKAPWFWSGQYPDGCEDLGYRELYTRWFQYGAFLPMFRSHGTDTPREVWRFGEEGEPFYDAIRAALDLRYRLLPYIYSLAAQEVREGYTMMRMLAFDFRSDGNVRNLADQFMFGPAFLVCPVTEPMYYGPGSTPLADVPQERPVYLPAGTDWYDFKTGEKLPGGQALTASAPLATMPLYVRAGSIIPMGPVVEHSAQAFAADWVIRIYPGADGEFTVYEDSGDGYGYESGESATWKLTWDDSSGVLSIGAREGIFPGMVESRQLTCELLTEDGVVSRSEPVKYSGDKLSLALR